MKLDVWHEVWLFNVSVSSNISFLIKEMEIGNAVQNMEEFGLNHNMIYHEFLSKQES